MRKLIWMLLVSACLAQSTPNLNFNIPSVGTPAWGPLMNANFTLLDSILGGQQAIPALTTARLDNLIIVDGVKYPFTSAGINQCLLDAYNLNLGGVCDASGVPNFTATAQINVGNHAIPKGVTLIVPAAGSWLFNITDGSSCGIKVYDAGAVIGSGVGASGAFSINAFSASTSMGSLLCTDPAPVAIGQYVYILGFSIGDLTPSGATFANGVVDIRRLYDGSFVGFIQAVNPPVNTPVFNISGVCCGTTFQNITANSGNVAGSMPMYIHADAVFGGDQTVACISCSIDHPGTGAPNLKIDESAAPGGTWNFYSPYLERNLETDLTTPVVDLVSGNLNVFGGMAEDFHAGTSEFAFRVENNIKTVLRVQGFKFQASNGLNTNGIQNLVTGHNMLTTSTGDLPDYTSAGMIVDGRIQLPGVPFASLGTPPNGTQQYCTDCNSTCSAGASTGRTCFRENGAWVH